MKKILNILSKLVIIEFIFLFFLITNAQNKLSKSIVSKITLSVTKTPSPIVNASSATAHLPKTVVTIIPTPTVDLFSELSKHSSQTDCWMKIDNNYYNITAYFSQHPGGDPNLLKYCGIDATTAFNTKDKAPGSSHSNQAKAILQSYLVQ